MKASWYKYNLQFRRPAHTSRGVYETRAVWYLLLKDNGITGIGECAPLPGLSKETPEQVEKLLDEICTDPERHLNSYIHLKHTPSVLFALETAWLDLRKGGTQILFNNLFTDGMEGIPINGLIWMGDIEFMQQQIIEKLESGFSCLKIKIGSTNFDQELEILRSIRNKYPSAQTTIRLDANGAFKPHDALQKLKLLAPLQIHSVEQPIEAGQWHEMEKICRESPIPIALDEELIGVTQKRQKEELLKTIQPAFLILKPSLHGGMSGCSEWIKLLDPKSTGWWITSYLESNIGLNAIAQWTSTLNAQGHQGLGTGNLYKNNIPSPLDMRGEFLWYDAVKRFNFTANIARS